MKPRQHWAKGSQSDRATPKSQSLPYRLSPLQLSGMSLALSDEVGSSMSQSIMARCRMPKQSDCQTQKTKLTGRVKAALSRVGYSQLLSLQLDIEDESTIVISGRTRSYYMKQVAQAVTLKVAGVEQVRNEIVVEPEN